MACVLVIDDDSTLRLLIAMTLEKAGHRVIQVAHGREGSACMRQEAVEMIITDLVMPDDSLDYVLALRAEYPDLPLILISGILSKSARMKAAAETLCAQHTLPKPFTLPELLAATKSVLTREPARPKIRRKA